MLEDLKQEREKKRDSYSKHYDPYPASVAQAQEINDVLKNFASLESSQKPCVIHGRIFAQRDQGKIIFFEIRDEYGSIQLVCDGEHTTEFELIKTSVDIGDIVEVSGVAYTTKRGEKSILVHTLHIVAKSLQPIPATWYGLEDTETKLRKRYLDLLLNKDVRELFVKKQRFWAAIRAYHLQEGFLEVETPVLEAVPGGADAEPFVTHHNALDRDFYLRISLELPLKKLLVGGFEKVFEIGRIFRNEGIDREHLQDYTQMECYAAYWDHQKMKHFVEGMFRSAIEHAFGSLQLTHGEETIDWSTPWKELDYVSLCKEKTGVDVVTATEKDLREALAQHKVPADHTLGKGRLIDLLYKKTVRPHLHAPAFLVGHPIEISPLAKRDPKHPDRALRFQVVALGTELGNGWAELNDPREQRARFEQQMKLREAGDKEAQQMDESFVEALEYGMPPAAGFGISERLFAVLAGKPVREAILFPLMKEES